MHNPISILVVDDSRTARRTIIQSLNISDAPLEDIYEASDGKEALAILASKRVDMVITDLNMPVMDGEGLLKGMRSGKLFKKIPVAVVSSGASEERISALSRYSISGFVKKPITPENIREVLVECFGEWNER